MEQITYRDGYRYKIEDEYTIITRIRPTSLIVTPFILLESTGFMQLRDGYAWDGPTGLPFLKRKLMRGSLVHDAFYQLFRENKLNHLEFRDQADQEFRDMCIEDGLSVVFAHTVYKLIRMFGEPFADPAKLKPPIVAP